ncbi:MAG: type VI secretion system baseplate subunit TssE [Proteobacteria bacterium]|nr:type VI secretion system baseplate subunit TssE [Pseudomonadota bacterium]
MNRSKIKKNIKGPLFNRLRNTKNRALGFEKPEKWISLDQLCESISAELNQLLSYQSTPPEKVQINHQELLTYGGPNLADVYSDNRETVNRVISEIKGLILIFIPHLKEPTITFIRDNPRQLNLVIDADLVFEKMKHPVSFEIPL